MAIKTVMDVIKEAIEKAFKKNNLDIDKFNHDITSFNSTGTKAIAIYENGDSIERIFVIVGLQPNLDGEWFATYFKDPRKGVGYMDGIDAMCDADAFLKNHD